jgi:hypothetical protein
MRRAEAGLDRIDPRAALAVALATTAAPSGSCLTVRGATMPRHWLSCLAPESRSPGPVGSGEIVELRRFASSFPIRYELRGTAVLLIRTDRLPRPWQLRLSGPGPTRICGIGGAGWSSSAIRGAVSPPSAKPCLGVHRDGDVFSDPDARSERLGQVVGERKRTLPPRQVADARHHARLLVHVPGEPTPKRPGARSSGAWLARRPPASPPPSEPRRPGDRPLVGVGRRAPATTLPPSPTHRLSGSSCPRGRFRLAWRRVCCWPAPVPGHVRSSGSSPREAQCVQL